MKLSVPEVVGPEAHEAPAAIVTEALAPTRLNDRTRLQGLMQQRTMPAHLLVCMGANVGARYQLGDGSLLIGRGPDCDVVLDDDRVSIRHAVLQRQGTHHRIHDIGSENGTLVNAERVDEIDLRDGDVVQVGYAVFRYVSGDALATRRPNHMQGRVEDDDSVTLPWSEAAPLSTHVASGHAGHLHPHPVFEEKDVSFADMTAQIRAVFAFFWPFRWLIVGLGFAGLVAGGVSAFVFPENAAAFFEVRLHGKASENPLEKLASSNVEFFRSASATFRGTALITKTLAAIGEPAPPPAKLQAIQDQLSFVNTASDNDSNTYTGGFRGRGPDGNLVFLEKHVGIYLDGELDKTLKIIETQIHFLQTQLDENEAALKGTEGKLLAFKKANIDGLPEQARQYYDYLFELQKKESGLESEVGRLSAEASASSDRLRGESPTMDSRIATGPYQQAIVDVNRQLIDARSRGLAAEHPDMKQLRSKLDELKSLAAKAANGTAVDSDVERSRNPAFDAANDRLIMLRAQGASAQRERVRLQADQQRVRGIVEKLPKLEAEYADLSRSYDATKLLHTRIFEQLKTAQLQYELEKVSASARHEIITPPRLEYVSPKGTFMKRSLLLGIAGLALAFAIAVALRARRIFAPV